MKLRYISGVFVALFLLQNVAHAQCTINASIVQFPDTLCVGDTLAFTANVGTNGVTFAWTGPSFAATGQNVTLPNVTIANTGTYRVIASKTGCPSDTDTVNIVINPLPATPVVSANTPLCVGDTLRLKTASGASTNGQSVSIWGPASFMDTLFESVIENASKANTGMYSAIVTDSFGCVSDTGHFTIPFLSINGRPAKPTGSSNSPICKGDTMKLMSTAAGAGENYTWEGPFGQKYTLRNVTIDGYTLTGRSLFTITIDSMGCKSEPDTVYFDTYPDEAPTVSISADPGFYVGIYKEVTLTASVVDTSLTTFYQWRKNGQDIIGQTGKTMKVSVGVDVMEGEFISVWASTTPSCAGADTASSPITAFTINTGVEELGNANTLRAFPNPVHDVLIIEDLQKGVTPALYNVTGTLMQVATVQVGKQLQIDMSLLPSGIYIIRAGERSARVYKD